MLKSYIFHKFHPLPPATLDNIDMEFTNNKNIFRSNIFMFGMHL